MNWMDDNILDLLPGIPWAQLLQLSISGRQIIADLLSVLAQCTSIEVCMLRPIISEYEFLPYSFSRISPILLPRLQHLSFWFITPLTVCCLPLLKCPCLRSIALDTFPRNELRPKFASFIHSVADTLESLEMIGNNADVSIDEDILSTISFVKYLILPLGHTFSKSALTSIGSENWLPNIIYMNFTIAGTQDDALGIINMLSARSTHDLRANSSNPVSRLMKVVIHCNDISLKDYMEPQLRDLRSRGMEITLLLE